jgi:Cu(I)/Ag(I) efflux system periplasmic protein CusF
MKGNMMKHHTIIATMLALAMSGAGAAQPQNHTGMGLASCQDMMKGMEIKNMDAKACQDMMKGMATPQAGKAVRHKAAATVKSVNPAAGTVILAHGPVKSLNWPAMTMGFAVKDKVLLDKLSVGRKVNIEFVQQDRSYIIMAVK